MLADTLRQGRHNVAHAAKLKIHRLQGRRIVHVLHIGKTGGSSIKYALRQASQDHPLSTGRVLQVSRQHVVVLHPHRISFTDIPAGEGVVFVLRDSVSRFVSGFHSRLREARPRKFMPWSDDERVAFEYFKTPNDLAVALSSEDEAQRARAESAMLTIGHVNTTYRKWLVGEAYLQSRAADVFSICFQENLSEGFLQLRDKLGMDISVALPEDPVKSHRTPDTFDKRLNDVAVANLRHWYRDDEIFMRVCREWEQPPASA